MNRAICAICAIGRRARRRRRRRACARDAAGAAPLIAPLIAVGRAARLAPRRGRAAVGAWPVAAAVRLLAAAAAGPAMLAAAVALVIATAAAMLAALVARGRDAGARRPMVTLVERRGCGAGASTGRPAGVRLRRSRYGPVGSFLTTSSAGGCDLAPPREPARHRLHRRAAPVPSTAARACRGTSARSPATRSGARRRRGRCGRAPPAGSASYRSRAASPTNSAKFVVEQPGVAAHALALQHVALRVGEHRLAHRPRFERDHRQALEVRRHDQQLRRGHRVVLVLIARRSRGDGCADASGIGMCGVPISTRCMPSTSDAL